MADNGGYPEEINALEAERKAERLSSRVREQRMPKRTEDAHLPTPPPDPWAPGCSVPGPRRLTRPRSLDEEEDIIAYLTDLGTPPFEGQTSECPSRNSAASTMAVTGTEEAFEHLDRLYGFTEQILELRRRSSRFFRRVRELERLKVLRNADRRLEDAFAKDKGLILDFIEEDTGFAESLLDAMLSNCRDPQFQRRNLRPPSSRQRSRSLAVSEQSLPPLSGTASRPDAEKTAPGNECPGGAPKVSKWTRVKAAFKWERACTNDVAESTMDPAATTPSTPTSKYLRIPDAGTGNWSGSTLSPSTSEISGPSTPLGRVSPASSSNEGSYDGPRRNTDRQSSRTKEEGNKESVNRRSRSLDSDMVMTDSLDGAERTGERNHGKPVIRITRDVNPPVEKRNGEKRPTPTLTITIPGNEEEIRSVSSPESVSPLPSSAQTSGGNSPQQVKEQRATAEEPTTPTPKTQRQDSKWNKVRRAFLTNSAFSVPPSPVRVVSSQSFLQDDPETPKAHSCSGSVEDLEKTGITSCSRAETRRDYQALREKLGAEFHRKLVEWERLKGNSPRASTRNGRARDAGSSAAGKPREGLLLPEERLAPEFKKKLQDWKRSKKGRRGSTSIEQQRVSKRRLTDWQLWRSPSKPDGRKDDTIGSRGSCGSGGSAGSTVSDGRSHLCEDFVRRMEAWRRMNEATYRATETSKRSADRSSRLGGGSGIDESEFLALEKVLLQFGDRVGRERRENDARQLEECFDGDTRLADGLQNVSCSNEVLIRTSVGSYRFEGISREFTRKLYDWEKYRGISPRSSTFRLLGPGYTPFVGEADVETGTPSAATTKIADEEKVFLGVLKRSKSLGSVVEGNTRDEPYMRRSTSLQSLERLANKLEEDRADNSLAPIGSQRTEDASEDMTIDDSEPEAMIVDIEDVIEETASPLKGVQPHQTPVYSVAASETTSIAVPLGTVTSSHEPSPVFLIEVEENANESHWNSRTWNRRKNSSEDSPSPDCVEETGVWRGRSDSLTREDLEQKDCPSNETWGKERSRGFRQFECHEWNSREACATQDGSSIKSNRSLSPIEWYEASQTGVLEESRDRDCIDLDRAQIPTVSSDGESASERNEPTAEPLEIFGTEEARIVQQKSGFAALPILAESAAESMDLPSEMKCEIQYEDQEEDVTGSSDDENDTVEAGRENDPEDREATSEPTDSLNSQSMDIQQDCGSVSRLSLESSENTFGNDGNVQSTVVDRERKEVYTKVADCISNEGESCQHQQSRIVKSDQNDNERAFDFSRLLEEREKGNNDLRSIKEEEHARIKGSLVLLQNQTECTESKEKNLGRLFQNYTSSSNNVSEHHREPIIRTTPLTMTSCREERCYERIIINEKTLNKIVVPTARAGDTKSLPRSSDTSSSNSSEEHSQSITINESATNRGTSPKKTFSPGKSVFVKTKRMIFLPFRRSEEKFSNRKESEASDEDRSHGRKSKSKSRSSSPKLSRQDAFLRMPLSLPWPLRPSSRDRELKLDAKPDEYLQSKRSGKERSTLEKRNEERSNDTKGRWGSQDARTAENAGVQVKSMRHAEENRSKSVYREKEERTDASARVISESQIRAPFSFSSSRLSSRETEIETSVSNQVPSDLMHKLKILSNVAARRYSETNAVSAESSLESHSSRIRRAKEDFLSRRGGPLCYSVLEPRASERSEYEFARPPSNYYEPVEIRDVKVEIEDGPKGRAEERRVSLEEAKDTGQGKKSPPRHPEPANPSETAGSRPDLVKSASAGMINVDPDTFGRLLEPTRGCESLPRTISKRKESPGPFAKIVNKFKLSRLIRGKDNDEKSMSTISRLCRQSLLIDVQPEFEEQENEDQETQDERSRADDKGNNNTQDAEK